MRHSCLHSAPKLSVNVAQTDSNPKYRDVVPLGLRDDGGNYVSQVGISRGWPTLSGTETMLVSVVACQKATVGSKRTVVIVGAKSVTCAFAFAVDL